MSQAEENAAYIEYDPPFLRPFLLSFLFGIPGSLLWFVVSFYSGWSFSFLTMLTGALCGLALRKHGGRFSAAILALTIHILVTLSLVTISSIAQENGESFLVSFFRVILHGSLKDFADCCFGVAGKTAVVYPFAYLTAYRVSDPE